MARKKKVKKFSAVKAVKAVARERIGVLPRAAVVPNRKRKAENQKPTLKALLENE
jgi:hypothetical protein